MIDFTKIELESLFNLMEQAGAKGTDGVRLKLSIMEKLEKEHKARFPAPKEKSAIVTKVKR